METLKNDTNLFIDLYGIYYISEVFYGGSLLAYHNMHQKEDYSRDLINHLRKDLDINSLSREGSEHFMKTAKRYED